jgi:hypothetical protein
MYYEAEKHSGSYRALHAISPSVATQKMYKSTRVARHDKIFIRREDGSTNFNFAGVTEVEGKRRSRGGGGGELEPTPTFNGSGGCI